MAGPEPIRALPHADFWKGKRVLLTGHTGFKGAWLAFWLSQLGAKVSAISLAPSTTPNLFSLLHVDRMVEGQFLDIRNASKVHDHVARTKPDIVLHLAAQALVRTSYRDPLETFNTNIMGTAHILDGLRSGDSTRVAVMVTTDKVYRNLERPVPYAESDALGGHDPYSASKAGSEMIVASYRDSFLAAKGVAVASARAGNVVGGGDWSDDRLIPDAVKAWTAGKPLSVRRPQAIRPWQHVLEPLCGYIVLAERLWSNPELAGAYNFGPAAQEAATVRKVITLAQGVWGDAPVTWGDGHEGPHEAGLLMLEASKARAQLSVTPKWPLTETINRTLHWYRKFTDGAAALDLCEADLAAYTACGSAP